MEDTAIAHRLRANGRIAIAPADIRVSARRWRRHPLRTLLIMNIFPLAYRFGVSPHSLARVYGTIR